jgi:hypothetical protein
MKKKKADHRFQVFGFAIPGSKFRIISESGQHIYDIEIESLDDAKQKFMSESVNADIIKKLGRTDFSTIFVEDPAGDDAVIEACRIMEESRGDDLQSFNGETGEASFFSAASKPNDEGVISVHTKGVVFEIESASGEGFDVIEPEQLMIGECCRFVAEGMGPSAMYEVVATAIHTGAEDSGDMLIQLKPVIENEISEPKFAPPTSGKKVIEVECDIQPSEQELRRLIRDMQNLELEANASAAEYREQIKAAKKRIYDMCNGKAYTHMECDVVNDWEAGERRYIRPDTGEVVKREEISMEERQLNLLPELDAATPDNPEPDQGVVESGVENSDSGEPSLEQPADELGNQVEQPNTETPEQF